MTTQIELLPAARKTRHRVLRLEEPTEASPDPRREQLSALAASTDPDVADCAAADLFREFGVSR